MSTPEDRELLERAANAAGLSHPDGWDWITNERGDKWNPLTDDGDALRLAVKLNMNVFQAAKSAYALPSDDDGTYEMQVRYSDAMDDPYAATRRAIVRAAAALGDTPGAS